MQDDLDIKSLIKSYVLKSKNLNELNENIAAIRNKRERKYTTSIKNWIL
jgi:hypothetical protein